MRRFFVGQGGFEPPTPSPPDLYAKPLRYCPKSVGNINTLDDVCQSLTHPSGLCAFCVITKYGFSLFYSCFHIIKFNLFNSTLISRSLHLLSRAKGGEEWRRKHRVWLDCNMKRCLDEEYEFELRLQGIWGEEPEGLCRNGEELGDKHSCTNGCPVNQEGCGKSFYLQAFR